MDIRTGAASQSLKESLIEQRMGASFFCDGSFSHFLVWTHMERGVKNDTFHPPLRSRNALKARLTVAFSSRLLMLNGNAPILWELKFIEIAH